MSQIEKITSRPRDSDRKTRIHLSLYDRIKFLLLFGLTYLVLTWSSLAENPILGVQDALNETARSKSWLLVLAVIEVIRQIHFLIAELLAPYHGIWTKYFAFIDRQVHRLSDWNRFRLSRIVKWALVVFLLAVILGAVYKEPPIKALFLAPKAFLSALPLLGQLLFAVFFGTGPSFKQKYS